MSATEFLNLYKQGIIDGAALNNALRSLDVPTVGIEKPIPKPRNKDLVKPIPKARNKDLVKPIIKLREKPKVKLILKPRKCTGHTKKGQPCTRRSTHGDRCFQHNTEIKTSKTPTKQTLLSKAKELDVIGRHKMNKSQLEAVLIASELPYYQSEYLDDYVLYKKSIRNNVKMYRLETDGVDTNQLFNEIHPKNLRLIERELEDGPIKFNLVLKVDMKKPDYSMKKPDDPMEWIIIWIHANPIPHFASKTTAILSKTAIPEVLKAAYERINENIEQWTEIGSEWKIHKILAAFIHIAKYTPLGGSSYIDLPEYLKNKKAILNVQNTDNQCLKWSLLAALHPVGSKDHPGRVTKYRSYENELDFDGVDFPTPISQIPKVEKRNELAINVFGYEGSVYPLYLTKDYSKEPVNLLLITEDDNSHYCWIKDFNKLCYDQTKHNNKKHYCLRCITNHGSEGALEEHMLYCKGNNSNPTRCVFPEEKDGKAPTIQFQNFKNLLKCPYVIYADIESIIRAIHSCSGEKQKTVKTSTHEGCSFGYNIIRSDRKLMGKRLYRGCDAMDKFFHSLETDLDCIRKDLKEVRPIKMDKEDWRAYNKASTCWICGGDAFKDEKGYKKVRDHDHITGKFRGAAHSGCNLRLSIKPLQQTVPVFFHNLKGYDAHHLMSALGKTTVKEVEYTNYKGEKKTFVDGQISCIAQNMEKLISFSWGQYRFVDSFAFLSASLSKLVDNTPNENLSITKTMNNFKLLSKKGVYPYEYMDDFSRFDEKCLPPKEAFYSKLTDEEITDEDYEHAKEVWNAFNCKTLGDYHDLYLETDVNLLSDVFENFRKTATETYDLDPANYFTLPGYSWDVLLKSSGVQLDQITIPDIYLFIEKGLRGGISMVSQRYGKANNKYMKDYDTDKPSSYLQYLDANNLYGWAMCQYLPTSGFKWSEASLEKVLETCEASDVGYILEVDLEYPKELHDKHNDYPLAPETMIVKGEWLSSYQNDLIKKLKVTGCKVPKLVPNLMDKKRYVLHYRNLQLYLSLGMKITKVHKILEFNQSDWMKPYIMKNTELRKQAKNDFEKDFYKLMNNAVFGKTMENIRKRVDIKLMRTTDEVKLKKYVAKPSFVRCQIFDEDLVGVQNHKAKVLLNKPIYVGMSILDLSKWLMYDFYYNHLKEKYGDSIQLLYTDTDSVVVHIQTQDLFEDMQENTNVYDTSNYDREHSLYSEINKKIPGLFKDELGGKLMNEFVGLRPKMYSYSGEMSDKKAKGVKKSVLKKTITHDDYRNCLFQQSVYTRDMPGLRSYNHIIYGETMTKKALSPLDTKRYIFDDGCTTLAFGHKDIPV